MDLFSILCTTCKSRLRVREQGAVGQILACPKCGGMVMVKPPDGWEPGKPLAPRGPEPVAGITAVVEMKKTDDTSSDANFDAIDDILENAPPKPKKPVLSVAPDAPGLARPRFVGKPPQHAPAAGKNGGAATAVAEPPVVASQPKPAADESEAADAVPDFKQPRPWRYWLLLAASIVAGVALAFVAVVASISFLSGDRKQQALAEQSRPTNPNPQPLPQVTPQSPMDTSPIQPVPATPSTSTKPVEPVVTPTEPTTSPSPKPAPTLPATTPKPPDARSPFDQILEPDKDPLAPPQAPTTKAATPAPADPADPPAAAKPLLPRPEPRQINVAARLADPLASIETDSTPLADFLQFMSDLSTIPITLEPDALPYARASATSPVALKLSSTSIGAALTEGLKPLGLEHVAIEDQLIVRLIEPAEMKELTYPHDDLTGGDYEAAAELAEMIQALVDPPSWKQGEASGTITVEPKNLRIRQRRASHAQIFLLCEKLRTARKLPHKSRHPAVLFQLDSRTKQAAAKLQNPVTINFHQPTPLARILPQLEEASGVRILVDWRDIASAGWNPAGEAVLSVEKELLALALTKLVEPMDLAWRAVDAQTIQIITPATLATRNELEFYQVAGLVKDDPAGESLVAKVRSALGDNTFLDQGGTCELRYDPAGQCLLASLPQPKQQDLEAFLITLRRPE